MYNSAELSLVAGHDPYIPLLYIYRLTTLRIIQALGISGISVRSSDDLFTSAADTIILLCNVPPASRAFCLLRWEHMHRALLVAVELDRLAVAPGPFLGKRRVEIHVRHHVHGVQLIHVVLQRGREPSVFGDYDDRALQRASECLCLSCLLQASFDSVVDRSQGRHVCTELVWLNGQPARIYQGFMVQLPCWILERATNLSADHLPACRVDHTCPQPSTMVDEPKLPRPESV